MKVDFCSELSRSENAGPDSFEEWRKPLVGFFKLNVDAAFYFYFKEACLGIVVRDSRGEVLWCAVEKVARVFSPLQAELKAIFFGMEEITGFSFQDIEVESDSLLVIREVENNKPFFM